MPTLSKPAIDTILTQNAVAFRDKFDAAKAAMGWEAFSTVSPATHSKKKFVWYQTPPVMTNVTHGPLEVGGAQVESYTVENDTHKAALEMDRAWFEDDDLDLIPPLVAQLANEASRYQAYLVLQQLQDNVTAYDGSALFATHSHEGQSINNDIGVTVAATPTPTAAEARTLVQTAEETMFGFADEKGRAQGLLPDFYIVPINWRTAMWQGLANMGSGTSIDTGSSDSPVAPLGQTVRVGPRAFWTNPFSDNANEIYAVYTGGETRPLLWSDRLGATMEPDMETLKVTRDKYIQSVRMRGNPGVGEFRHIIRITAST